MIPLIRMGPVNKIRIVVADDNDDLLNLVMEVLEPEFEIVAAVQDGRDLLQAVKNFKPDVVIADISMPEMSGIEATMKIVEEGFESKIILLSMHKDPSILEEGISAGAKGYVYKLAIDHELVPAVYEVIQERFYISPLIKS